MKNTIVKFDQATKTFVCECDYKNKDIPKFAGFHFNPMTKLWETKKFANAIKLQDFFDDTAKRQIGQKAFIKTAWTGRFIHPKDQSLKEFQLRAAKFALERNHSYLALEQGLGKTPTACVVINSVGLKTLIVCPPFLVENWKRELKAWLVTGLEFQSINSGKQIEFKSKPPTVIILPDTLLDRPAIKDFIQGQEFGLLVVDEAHRFKTPNSKRSKVLYEFLTTLIPKVVMLSGTPMPNRPIELYPVLSNLAPQLINFLSWHDYGLKFCNAYQSHWGWDYGGASNLTQLRNQIEDFMLRETKETCLPELPAKVERQIVLTREDQKEVRKIEKSLFQKFGEEPESFIKRQNLGEIASYRKELGLSKVQVALEYIAEILANTGEQLLVFAWHTEVLAKLEAALKDCSKCEIIDGSTPMKARQFIVDGFQNGRIRVLLAQVQTMVGYNLTRASRCIFVECSWSPADNSQATDRAHRIGQKDAVIVDYLVLAKTFDEKIMNTLLYKRKLIDKVLSRNNTNGG